MSLSLLLAAALVGQVKPAATYCPMTGEVLPVGAPGISNLVLNGTRYTICCPECAAKFKASPSKALADKKLVGKTVGVFLFDPVGGQKIDEKTAKGATDYKGVRYFFADFASKQKFLATPTSYAVSTEQEAIYCPVMNHETASIESAGAFADYNGVRYYLCCPGCLGQFKGEPEKYVPNAAKAVKRPSVVTVSAK